MPIPGFAESLTIALELGPMLRLGRLLTGGIRSLRTVVGGGVEGEAGLGFVTGGIEMLLARQDGVTMIESNYMVVMTDGTPVRVFGNGYVTRAPDFEGTRMSILFEVDQASPHAWLARRAFMAERRAGTQSLRVAQIV